MHITKDTAVTLSYRVTDPATGKPLDTGHLAYLHGGYENIFPKVESALEAVLARFFGSVKIDSDRYARDIGNVTREVIDRLAGAGARLDITIDIQATKPDGFDESEVRTIGENARVLKFDPSSGFEKS